jgi:hypothetical protein
MHMAPVAGAISDVVRRRTGQTNARSNSRADCSVELPLSIRIPKNGYWEADRRLQPSADTIHLSATFAMRQRPFDVLGTNKIAPQTIRKIRKSNHGARE